MSEELALEQLFGDGGAVDGDEPCRFPVAHVVDCAGNQFLARATLAEDQHRGVRWRDLLHHPAQPEHARVGGDHALKGRAGLALAQDPVLLLQRADLERPVDDQPQYVDVERLLVEVVGAQAYRLHGVVAVGITGDHDDLGARRQAQDLAERRHALADALGIRRQPQVLQHDRRLEAAQLAQCFLARDRLDYLQVVEGPLELLLQALVVLDDQQSWLVFGHLATSSLAVLARLDHLCRPPGRLPEPVRARIPVRAAG